MIAPRCVEPPGDGAEEALFRFDVGRDRPKQRRLLLVGAIGAAEPLYCGIGFPAGLQQIMHAQPLIPGRQIGVIAAAGAAGVGKHQDALFVVHECRGLGEIGASRAVLDDQPVAARR